VTLIKDARYKGVIKGRSNNRKEVIDGLSCVVTTKKGDEGIEEQSNGNKGAEGLRI